MVGDLHRHGGLGPFSPNPVGETNKHWHWHTHLSYWPLSVCGAIQVGCGCCVLVGFSVWVACWVVVHCPGPFPRPVGQGRFAPMPGWPRLLQPCVFGGPQPTGSCCCMHFACGMTGTWEFLQHWRGRGVWCSQFPDVPPCHMGGRWCLAGGSGCVCSPALCHLQPGWHGVNCEPELDMPWG